MDMQYKDSIFYGCTTTCLSWLTESCSEKTDAKYDHQNQAINIEFSNDQSLRVVKEGEMSQIVHIKSID